MTENVQPNTAPILDRFQLETPEDIDRYDARNRRQIALNEASRRHRADIAAVARQRLTGTARGATALAEVEAIRAGNPATATIALAHKMTDAERAAEANAERYAVDAGWIIEALHHTAPALQELQKLAFDARHRLAGLHMVNVNGQKPTAETVNPDNGHLLTSVVVHSSSRPGVRWVLGDSLSFGDVVKDLNGDVHCDMAAEPFAKKLEPHKTVGKADCVVDLADDAANQRTQHKYYEHEMRTVADEYRKKLSRPAPMTVGLLFPVAFSNEIVVLKFCHGHALAFTAKYEIQIGECGIEEPWESVGNYW